MFYVVEFDCDKSIEVVPELWITIDDDGVHCLWPLTKGRKKLLDMIQSQTLPQKNWRLYSVTIKRKCGMCSVFTASVVIYTISSVLHNACNIINRHLGSGSLFCLVDLTDRG